MRTTIRAGVLPTVFGLGVLGCGSGNEHAVEALADVEGGSLELSTKAAASCGEAVTWYAGSFRKLPEREGSLVSFVDSHPHPSTFSSVPLGSSREAAFANFVTALLDAVDANRTNSNGGDWCLVRSRAATAGYGVYRFWDTSTSRYFIYAHDTATSNQQAFFFINPFARRNVVVEAPHAGFDTESPEGAAKLFVSSLAPRALIINGSRRCASSTVANCDGSSTSCAARPWSLSDVAHARTNTFYKFHQILNARAGLTDRDMGLPRFVQIHTFGSSDPNQRVIFADGSARDMVAESSSIANRAETSTDTLISTDASTHSCQDGNDRITLANGLPADVTVGDPRNRCAEKNVEGRLTNDPSIANTCTSGDTLTGGSRFLHVEGVSDVWRNSTFTSTLVTWQHVRDGLRSGSVMGACNMTCNATSTSCVLGPALSRQSQLSCP